MKILALIIIFTGCASPRPAHFDWDFTLPAVEPLDFSKPAHQPMWTFPEDWELRNHNRLPKPKFI